MSAEVKVEVQLPPPPEVELPDLGTEFIGSGKDRLVINIDKPQWDQETFYGRLRYSLARRNPLNLFASDEQLQEAKETVRKYKVCAPMDDVTVNELWSAKMLFDSTFHPDTGEKVPLLTRRSAIVPVDGTITGLLLSFYRSIPGIVIWQSVKQCYNCAFDIANHECDQPEIKCRHYGTAYTLATGAAIMTVLALGSFIKKKTPPVVGRLLPFVGVAAAACVSVPILKIRNMYHGIPVTDETDTVLGNSGNAAVNDIFHSTIGTVGLIAPAFVLTPFVIDALERQQFFCKYPWAHAPIHIVMASLCILLFTPLVRAVYPDKCDMNVLSLEPSLQEEIKKSDCEDEPTEIVYYRHHL